MKVMDEFIQVLKKYQGQERPDIPAFYNTVFPMQQELLSVKDLKLKEKEQLCQFIVDHYEDFHDFIKIYLDSFLAYQFDDQQYTMRLLRLVKSSPFLTKENWMYVYYQMLSYGFHVPSIKSEGTRKMLREMYCTIYEYYRKKLQVEKDIVPVHKRNPKLVVFFISQFLNENHGPTKTVLDRCYALSKSMGMRTIIINTAEMVNKKGGIPIFAAFQGNYSKLLNEYDSLSYKEFNFPFSQCSDTMPNIPEMKSIIDLIKQLNPYCIFHVGGNSFTADICSNYYPLINVATVPSGITTTQGQFQLTGKHFTEDDIAYVKSYGLTDNHLQYCLFTSTVMHQMGKMSREECGIPEDKFAVLVVGARLGFEVDSDFIENALLPIMEQGEFIVFAGRFEEYDKMIEKYPLLKNNSVNMGFVKDILALNEICDAYANPKRTGGGTSVVEAMIKGLPPVTLPGGDVALGAGEEFQVANYDEMASRLLQLRDDSNYYKEMSEKALARVKILTDTESAFLDAFHRIEQMEEFQ